MTAIIAEKLAKVYDRKTIFQNVSFEVYRSERLVITGANGSGKSTLLKILASIASASSGKTIYRVDESELNRDSVSLNIGFVSPYLNFYDELTGLENILFAVERQGATGGELEELFHYFRLSEAKHKPVKAYSSGMIQRLRFIQAFAKKPAFLFLDEPTAMLDDNGREMFWRKLNDLQSQTITILASNDAVEISQCPKTLCIEEFKPQSKSRA